MSWSPNDKHLRHVQRCAHCGVAIHPEEIYCGVCASEQEPEIGIQPEPTAAKMVSDVAVLLERYGDDFFDN